MQISLYQNKLWGILGHFEDKNKDKNSPIDEMTSLLYCFVIRVGINIGCYAYIRMPHEVLCDVYENGVEPVKLTVKEFNLTTRSALPQNIRSYFESNGTPAAFDTLYDARALEVIGIEGIKKEPDASAKVGGQIPRARGTSDPAISISDLLQIVKGDAEKYIPQIEVSNSYRDADSLDNQTLLANAKSAKICRLFYKNR